MSERVRVHKALADAGVASRRAAEKLVIAGRVAVNGVTATVGLLVDPAADQITVDGKQISSTGQSRVYLLLAKPAGVTSTVSDRHAEQTVVDFVPAALRQGAARLYPVGRLDRDSEGLLLLTNDGAWAQRILHPRHGIEREYAVGLVQPLTGEQRDLLSRGLALEEGTARLIALRPATSAETRRLDTIIGQGARGLHWYQVTLGQGMKRQVRRMFGAVDAPVHRLLRVRIGTLRIGDMALGATRRLSSAERGQLEGLVGRPEGRGRPDPAAGDGGLVVSVDGPGGSGKSTVGMRAAERVGYRFCDTGVLYRGLTWLAMTRGVDFDSADALVGLIPHMRLEHDKQQRYVRLIADGKEITDELHTAEVDREVSRVSQHAQVRAALLPLQRGLADGGRLIMAGRDIGTVVLPDADLKLYLEVSVAERARRRAAERGVADDPRALAQIEGELRQRDEVDSTRATSPLRVPEGATVVDTSDNTLEQSDAQVVALNRTAERDEALDD
ncbi:MAG: CMP/dCMP kinase [Chloroflexota bacterium]|nr:CMP/dCMP kinase [Chloroflexota bacterium]